MYKLNTPIKKLTRVGQVTARQLNRLDINDVSDLIYYFPFRYEDFSQQMNIKELQPQQIVTVKGEIILINNRRTSKKRMVITEALLEDDTGTIRIIWFNQPFLIKNIKIGQTVSISGKVDADHLGLKFVSPSYEKLTQSAINTGKIVPVYPVTDRLTQKQLRFLINISLKSLELVIDWLPTYIVKKHNLVSLAKALQEIHFPTNLKKLEQARYRLKFDELFLIQIQSQLSRQFISKTKAPPIKFQEAKIKEFVNSLPFTLTDDQKKTAWQIFLDLDKEQATNRLIEGDVGSGKTVVAALAILNVILNKYQTVLMVPTEILAKQHYYTLVKFFEKFKINIALLTGSENLMNKEANISRKDLLLKISKGKVDLLIGTHALIQESVSYKNLGLVIVDEQHRFGVEQRKKIKQKNKTKESPHFVSMTATPIPRSLALILYGDLDLSIIKQMPKGRKKIITKLVEENKRDQAYQFIRQEITKGRQVFVICPLIDPSDKLGVKSVKEEFEKLDKQIFPDLNIGLLHGKLKSKEKEQIMRDMEDNKINILVSTSVVEVGIDIPNATIMMIEGSDRFGLAQLHQFRGRVGRGEDQAYCFLFTDNYSMKTRERLVALVKSADGFALAEYDLKFRGPGEVFGTQQSGLPNFKIANFTDLELIKITKKQALEFFQNNEFKDFPLLEQKLAQLQLVGHLE